MGRKIEPRRVMVREMEGVWEIGKEGEEED